MTIVFVSNINPPAEGNKYSFEVSEDIDALVQLMTLLNHKLRGTKGIDFKVYLHPGDRKSGLHLLYGKLGLKIVESRVIKPLMIENVVYIAAYRALETLWYQLEPLIRIISNEEWLKEKERKGYDKMKNFRNLFVEVHDILTDKFTQALMKEVYDSV